MQGTHIDSLTRWDDTKKGQGGSKKKQSEDTKFAYAPELNAKLVLWRGDIVTLEGVDGVVHSTNEAMTERTEMAKRLFARAGKELVTAVTRLEGCKTGEAKLTPGYDLPYKFVIHTVGPRYNEKYRIAAENALHNCYRNSLQALTENGGLSMALPVINSEKRGYPPANGAHIAIRTIRRFLERHGKSVDTIAFVMDNDDEYALYEKTLCLYFPRNKDEEREATAQLPEDTGSETGETVVEERKIRIATAPTVDRSDSVVDDGHLFHSLTEMKDHPDKQRLGQKPNAESSGFCILF